MRVKTKRNLRGIGIGISWIGDTHIGVYSRAEYEADIDKFVSAVHVLGGDVFESPDETLLPMPVQRPDDAEDVAVGRDQAGADAWK